jgi:hypothetical protein
MDSQAYEPEWILGTQIQADFDNEVNNTEHWPVNQRSHVFGLTYQPRQWRISDMPSYWALAEGGDSAASGDCACWQPAWNTMYRGLLILFSGIQLAGPDLTPQSFERGMQAATYPNPVTRLNAGFVGYQGGSHTTTVDAAEWFYSPEPVYGICYVDHGARHGLGDWPRGDAGLFTNLQNCDTGR